MANQMALAMRPDPPAPVWMGPAQGAMAARLNGGPRVQALQAAGARLNPPVQRAAPVAQLWLDQAALSGRPHGQTDALAQLAHTYNSNRKGKSRTTRLNQLEALHVALLRWLDAHREADMNVSASARWAKGLLNAVQDEHEVLVAASVNSHDTDPPIANFAALPDLEKQSLRRTWAQLVGGTGNIRITEQESYTDSDTNQPATRQHQGFRIEVLAQFARLLNTATGRGIVAQVNAGTGGQRLVTIKPGYAQAQGGAPGKSFAASPTGQDGADKLTEFDMTAALAALKGKKDAKRKRAALLAKFVDLNLSAIHDPGAKAAAIYATRRAHPRAYGVKMAGKYYKFGQGASVDVTITRDIRDASDHHTARLVDANRDEIPGTNFITLGHELGHAAHMQSGVALGQSKVSDHLLGQVGVIGAEELNWSNMEEFANIHAVENTLRGDYGLTPRFGHINQSSVQVDRLMPVFNTFITLSNRQPQNDRGPVDQHINAGGQALLSMKIPEARKKLKRAATVFSNQLPQAFPGFTQNEFGLIRTQLNQFKVLIDSARAADITAADQCLTAADGHVTTAEARVQLQQAQPQPAPRRGWSIWNPFGF